MEEWLLNIVMNLWSKIPQFNQARKNIKAKPTFSVISVRSIK